MRWRVCYLSVFIILQHIHASNNHILPLNLHSVTCHLCHSKAGWKGSVTLNVHSSIYKHLVDIWKKMVHTTEGKNVFPSFLSYHDFLLLACVHCWALHNFSNFGIRFGNCTFISCCTLFFTWYLLFIPFTDLSFEKIKHHWKDCSILQAHSSHSV